MTVAPWLQCHLEATGLWNADGIGRAARTHRCDCGTWTWRGLDDPRCAGPATVDTTPLTPLGEAVALLAGRTTYALTRRGQRLELNHRHQWAVRASATDGDVLAEHRCGSPLSAAFTTTTRIPALHRHQEATDDPPF